MSYFILNIVRVLILVLDFILNVYYSSLLLLVVHSLLLTRKSPVKQVVNSFRFCMIRTEKYFVFKSEQNTSAYEMNDN